MTPDRTDRRASGPRGSARARRIAGAVAIAALVVAGAACSSDTTDATAASSSSTSAAPTGVTETSSSYGTIAALHDAVVDGGFECTLEYPGLKDDVTSNEVSICTIEAETAYLTIWGDPANLAEFAASSDGSTGTVALGSDWTIAVTSADLASRLADELGGTAPSGSAPVGTTP